MGLNVKLTHADEPLSVKNHRSATGSMDGELGPIRSGGRAMDDERQLRIAYEYLCHLEEARRYWTCVLISICLWR